MNKVVKNVLMFGAGVLFGGYAYGYHLFERTKDGTAYVCYKNRDGIYEYGTNPLITPETKQEETEVPE